MLAEIAFLRSAVEELQTATAFVYEDDTENSAVHHEDTAVCVYSGLEEYQCTSSLGELTSSNVGRFTKIGSVRVHSSTTNRTEVEALASTLVQTLCQTSLFDLVCDTDGSVVYLDDLNSTTGT